MPKIYWGSALLGAVIVLLGQQLLKRTGARS